MELTDAIVVRLPAVLNRSTVRDLRIALEHGCGDTQRAAIVLVGTDDETFCGGMDISAACTDDAPADALQDFALCLEMLRMGPKPALSFVRGTASGGGVGLAAACDGVLAAPDATFRLPELLFGLIPSIVLPYIAERISPQKLRWMALASRQIGSDEALRTGLVDNVSSVETCPRVMRSWIRKLKRVAPDTVQLWKRASGPHQVRDPGQGVELSLQRLTDAGVRERIRGFVETGEFPWRGNDR